MNLKNYSLGTPASVYTAELIFKNKEFKLIQVSETQTLSSQCVFLPEKSHSLLRNILALGSEMREEQLVGVFCFIKKGIKELTSPGCKCCSFLKIKSKEIELLIEKLIWFNALQCSLINMILLFCCCLDWSIGLYLLLQEQNGEWGKTPQCGKPACCSGTELPADWDRSSGQCWRDGEAQILPDWCKTGPGVSATKLHWPSSFCQQPLIVLGWRILSSEPQILPHQNKSWHAFPLLINWYEIPHQSSRHYWMW